MKYYKALLNVVKTQTYLCVHDDRQSHLAVNLNEDIRLTGILSQEGRFPYADLIEIDENEFQAAYQKALSVIADKRLGP